MLSGSRPQHLCKILPVEDKYFGSLRVALKNEDSVKLLRDLVNDDVHVLDNYAEVASRFLLYYPIWKFRGKGAKAENHHRIKYDPREKERSLLKIEGDVVTVDAHWKTVATQILQSESNAIHPPPFPGNRREYVEPTEERRGRSDHLTDWHFYTTEYVNLTLFSRIQSHFAKQEREAHNIARDLWENLQNATGPGVATFRGFLYETRLYNYLAEAIETSDKQEATLNMDVYTQFCNDGWPQYKVVESVIVRKALSVKKESGESADKHRVKTNLPLLLDTYFSMWFNHKCWDASLLKWIVPDGTNHSPFAADDPKFMYNYANAQALFENMTADAWIDYMERNCKDDIVTPAEWIRMKQYNKDAEDTPHFLLKKPSKEDMKKLLGRKKDLSDKDYNSAILLVRIFQATVSKSHKYNAQDFLDNCRDLDSQMWKTYRHRQYLKTDFKEAADREKADKVKHIIREANSFAVDHDGEMEIGCLLACPWVRVKFYYLEPFVISDFAAPDQGNVMSKQLNFSTINAADVTTSQVEHKHYAAVIMQKTEILYATGDPTNIPLSFKPRLKRKDTPMDVDRAEDPVPGPHDAQPGTSKQS